MKKKKIHRFPRVLAKPIKGASSKVLLRVIQQVNKKYLKMKKGERFEVSLFRNSVFSEVSQYVSSGILPVDCVVHFGTGFPIGIIEVYGPEAGGKTAVMENTIAEAQRRNYYTILFPTEYSVDAKRVKGLKMDEDKLLIGDVETIEDVYDQLRTMVTLIRQSDKRTPIVIGWDSIAATPTRRELAAAAGLESSDYGQSALQMSKLFRRLVRFLFRNKVCLICVNQTRTNLGVKWGSKESTFGGKALRFYAWVRLRMAKIKTLVNKHDEKIGYMAEMQCVKNKVAPPERKCLLPIYFDRGIDRIQAIFEYCIDREIITQEGTGYRYRGKVVTRKSFKKFYPKYQEELDARMRKSTAVRAEED